MTSVSHTPIYDGLRETRLIECTADLAAAAQATIRLVVPHCSEAGKVRELASRRGVGGRHRRSA